MSAAASQTIQAKARCPAVTARQLDADMRTLIRAASVSIPVSYAPLSRILNAMTGFVHGGGVTADALRAEADRFYRAADQDGSPALRGVAFYASHLAYGNAADLARALHYLVTAHQAARGFATFQDADMDLGQRITPIPARTEGTLNDTEEDPADADA